MDSQTYSASFAALSEKAAGFLGIEQDLETRNLAELEEIDFFAIVDRKILTFLVHQVVDQAITFSDCEGTIWRRRATHWYREYEHVYEAILEASHLIAGAQQLDPQMTSASNGAQSYIATWHELDAAYRKYLYHTRLPAGLVVGASDRQGRKPLLKQLPAQGEHELAR